MTIVEFLLARIAEDEAVARETQASADLLEWAEGELGIDGPVDGPSGHATIVVSPERLLAECEAKRRIVELYRGVESSKGNDAMSRLDQALRALAVPYASHSDYRREWRP